MRPPCRYTLAGWAWLILHTDCHVVKIEWISNAPDCCIMLNITLMLSSSCLAPLPPMMYCWVSPLVKTPSKTKAMTKIVNPMTTSGFRKVSASCFRSDFWQIFWANMSGGAPRNPNNSGGSIPNPWCHPPFHFPMKEMINGKSPASCGYTRVIPNKSPVGGAHSGEQSKAEHVKAVGVVLFWI